MLLKLFHLSVLTLLFQVSQSSTDVLWTSWKKQHQKVYSDETEEAKRRSIWNNNFELIQKHNSENHSFTLELNHLADLVRNEKTMFINSQPGSVLTNH